MFNLMIPRFDLCLFCGWSLPVFWNALTCKHHAEILYRCGSVVVRSKSLTLFGVSCWGLKHVSFMACWNSFEDVCYVELFFSCSLLSLVGVS